MKNNFIKTFTIIFLFAFTSCNMPECKNTNPIFEKYLPEQKEYKDELVKQLKRTDNSKLTYWFDKCREDDSLLYLHVFIQGDGLCAKGVVTIKKWDDKLEDIHKTKGKGYSGAELKNLKIVIYQDSIKTELIYEDVDAVLD